jgi:hypothetical protein
VHCKLCFPPPSPVRVLPLSLTNGSKSLHLHFIQASSNAAEFVATRNTFYWRAVGALDQVAQATHPNTASTVSTAARITATPRPAHQDAFKRISRYPAGMLDPQLAYSEATHALEGYADTDSSMAAHHHTGMAF